MKLQTINAVETSPTGEERYIKPRLFEFKIFGRTYQIIIHRKAS